MFDLTPQERRGALIVLTLFAVGTLWDLLHRGPSMTPTLPARLEMPADTALESAAEPGRAPPAAGGVSAASPPANAPRRGKSPPSQPLALASATADEFAQLPGIGPVLAKRIVERRERMGGFRSVDDLLAVPGIGPRLFERIRPWLRAGANVRSARR